MFREILIPMTETQSGNNLHEIIPKASEILPIDELRISSHALERFSMRCRISLVESGFSIRSRLAQATVLSKNSDLTSSKKEKKKRRDNIYFTDAKDKDITYVVGRNRRTGKRELLTILYPMRSSTGRKLSGRTLLGK
jgi:hypothetical protein